MVDVTAWLWSGAWLLGVACAFWLVSLKKADVSIVDSLWSLMFLMVALVYALLIEEPGPRAAWVAALVAVWAIRLSAYITWRNHGEAEDYRYQEIRRNNEPGFRFKSLYIVFGLQAVLAWIISLPLVAAISGTAPLGLLDVIGVTLWLVGVIFESVGDWQLARFKTDPANRDRVMDQGLWRYTRHPNYFGNFTLWWGFFFMAWSAGAPWTIVSPLLMSFLLLRVSGVALLEKDIVERRPKYADYVRKTNAFFPGRTKA
jgi:steroid 5-alpha reductase family enzyme